MKYSTIKLNIAESAKVTGATKVYQNRPSFPAGDATWEGTYAFAQDSDRLYLHTGQGWFNIAIINTVPLWVTEPNTSYTLAADATAYNNGTATEVIVRARDSEGMELTWSYTADAAMNNIANISLDSTGTTVNKYIIEPATEDSAGSALPANGTLTFKVSDGVNTLSKASTFSLAFDYSVVGSESAYILTKGIGNNGTNSTFTDNSDDGRTVTPSDMPMVGSFSPYSPSNWSTWFDGTTSNGGHLDFPDHADWNLGGTDWTIEFWINPYHQRHYDTICAIVGTLAIEQKGGNICIWMSSNGSSWDMASETQISYQIPVGEWSHYAIVFDDTANTLKSYTNGSLTHTLSSITGTMNNSSNVFRIGAYTDNNWYGFIADFRLVKGTKVYTADFTPPTESLTAITNTKLLTCQGNRFGDVTGTHTVTVEGATAALPHIIGYSPYKVTRAYSAAINGGSVYLDGTNDLLTIPNSADFAFGQPGGGGVDFTIEMWIYKTSTTSGSEYDGLLYWSTHERFKFNASDVKINCSIDNTEYDLVDGVDGVFTSTFMNTWSHLAIVREGSTIKTYVNGVLQTSFSNSGSPGDSSNNLIIGRNYSASHEFGGYLSDIRIVKGKAVYTGAFTPPSGPLTKTGGTYPSNTNIVNPTASETKLLLNFTDGKVIDQGGRTNFRLHGSAKSSTGVSKFGSDPTIYFDGTDDGIEVLKNPLTTFPADFTIEGWYYTAEVNTQESARWRTIWFCGTSTDLQLGWDDSNSKLVVYHDSTLITSSVATTLNTWQHVAVTRSAQVVDQAMNKVGGVLKLFLNGVEVGSVANTAVLGNYSNNSFIGSYSATQGGLNGYLSDLKLTYGESKYPFKPLKETLTNTTSFQTGRTITSSHTKLITAHASSISDGSGTGHTVTAVSSAAVSTFAPRGDMYSVALDGTDDSLKTAVSTDFRVAADANWTIEGWFFFTTNPTSTQTHIFNYSDDSGFNWGAIEYMMYITTGGILTMEWAGGSGLIQHDIGNGTDFPLNQWHHIAVTCDSTNVHMFWNGTHLGSDNNAFTNTSNSSFLQIGRGCAGNNAEIGGYVSNFRFIKGSCAYTKDFTPSATTLDG